MDIEIALRGRNAEDTSSKVGLLHSDKKDGPFRRTGAIKPKKHKTTKLKREMSDASTSAVSDVTLTSNTPTSDMELKSLLDRKLSQRSQSLAKEASVDRHLSTKLEPQEGIIQPKGLFRAGSLMGKWKRLNDEFQNRYVDANQKRRTGKVETVVKRISNFEKFDNVKQVFGGMSMSRAATGGPTMAESVREMHHKKMSVGGVDAVKNSKREDRFEGFIKSSDIDSPDIEWNGHSQNNPLSRELEENRSRIHASKQSKVSSAFQNLGIPKDIKESSTQRDSEHKTKKKKVPTATLR